MDFQIKSHGGGFVKAPKQLYSQHGAAKLKGPRQTHGKDQGVQIHFRLTMELRHVVMKYFSSEAPVGSLGKALLVVAGEHCRLSNICEVTGTWKEDEEFMVGARTVRRKMGLKVNRNMETWGRAEEEAP